MKETRHCPQCGAALPKDTLDGLCPQCVARVVFGEASGGGEKPPEKPATRIKVEPDSDKVIERSGMRIGRYKLLEQIGEGGFGVVYMAEQVEPVQRKVALKVVKAGMDSKEVIARFEAERQALALMDHPNIAKVLEAGTTDTGRPYFVMELVKGIPITEFCDLKKLSPTERLQLFVKVCSAVQHAHQKGIIHRDLKPSNVLVTLHDGEPVPKVIDFGVAKALGHKLTEKTLFTAFSHLIGTPAYMSPEQAELSGLDIDTRSDIYSLGVLLYELLTGVTPLDKDTMARAALDEVRRMIRETEPPTPSRRLTDLVAVDVKRLESGSESDRASLRRRLQQRKELIHLVRGDLDWIVMKCLEKDRKRRYETANGLAMDVQRHLNDEPIVARPPSRLYTLQKTVQRHKFGFAAAGAIMVVLVAGVVVSTWQAVRATRAEGLAEREAIRGAQVARFLKGMLEGVGPSVAMGRNTELLREILDQTADRVEKELQDQPEVEAELLHTIGVTYFELGEAPKAIGSHREALRLRWAVFGETNNFVAASLKVLGDALELANEFKGAAAAYRQSLAIRRQLFVGDHPDLARSLSCFGSILPRDGGTRQEAEALMREALAMQRRLFPEGHQDIVDTLVNLGTAVRGQARPKEAEEIDRELLELSKKLHGDENPDVATALTRLGWDLMKQERLSDAEPFLREGYKMRRKFLGNDHPYVVSPFNSLTDLLLREGKFSEAEEYLRDHLASSQKTNFNRTAGLLGRLAEALIGQGKRSEAQAARRDALRMRLQGFREPHPADDPQYDAPLVELTQALIDEQRWAEAEVVARQSLALREKIMPERWFTFNTHSVLGGILCELKKYEEAEPLLLSGYKGLKQREDTLPAVGKVCLRHSFERLVQFYEATSRPAKAAEWKQKLAEFEQDSHQTANRRE